MGRAQDDPHAGSVVLEAGVAVERARGVIVLVHGRGATAEGMLGLVEELGVEDFAVRAPEAAGRTWYPHSFMAALEANQPWVDSAIGRVEAVVGEVMGRGVGSERICLLGFSQGACLVLEYVARHARRYGAVMGLTGGLIGPVGTVWNYPGTLGGTPVFLGAGDPDPHVPFERVRETAGVLGRMGAEVELRRYAGMPHSINADELEACRKLLAGIGAAGGQTAV